MAVLGVGGKLRLKRSAPEACVISSEAVIPEINSLQSICPGYWNGDHVSTICLPLASDVFPANPGGYAAYFDSRWFLGPNRSQISSRSDKFYKEGTEEYPDGQFGGASQFYSREGDVSGGETIDGCQNGDYWIHVDELGRVSFYTSRCNALRGCEADRVMLAATTSAGQITVSPFGSAAYFNAVWECISEYGEYQFSDGQDTITLISICADAPSYEIPEAGVDEYDNADLLPRGQQGSPAPFWQILCDLAQWSLELNAPSIDTTSVSEKFGNAVKSLVTGGGSAEFLIDRKCYEDDEDNGLALLQLLMMTEKGCEATAQFWMVDRAGSCGVTNGSIQGNLYYEANILVTASAVNLRPAEIVAGTVQFVTTEDIKLLVSS